ncbi:hypothetical protein RYX36_033751 [Vicia faba]
MEVMQIKKKEDESEERAFVILFRIGEWMQGEEEERISEKIFWATNTLELIPDLIFTSSVFFRFIGLWKMGASF